MNKGVMMGRVGLLAVVMAGLAACVPTRNNPMVVMVERSPVAYTVPAVATPAMPVGTMVPLAPTAARAGTPVPLTPAPQAVQAPVAPRYVPQQPAAAPQPGRTAPSPAGPIQASPVVAMPGVGESAVPPADAMTVAPLYQPMLIPTYTAPSYAPPLKGKVALPVLQ